jgi:hypothetical protein
MGRNPYTLEQPEQSNEAVRQFCRVQVPRSP